jgi:type I restriction enzyme, S subunit
MSIRATVGTTAVVPPELDGANLTQGTARISPGKGVTLEYLLGFLRSTTCQRWIQGQVKGATFREITLTRLRELEVPVPPLHRQEKYSVCAESIARLGARADRDCANAINLFGSLSQRGFRGEL